MRFLVIIVSNYLGLWLSSKYINGFILSNNFKEMLIVSTFLAILFFILKPLLKIISAPIILITLGLFILIINGFLLWITDYFFEFMRFETYIALGLTTIIISLTNVLFGIIYRIIK